MNNFALVTDEWSSISTEHLFLEYDYIRWDVLKARAIAAVGEARWIKSYQLLLIPGFQSADRELFETLLIQSTQSLDKRVKGKAFKPGENQDVVSLMDEGFTKRWVNNTFLHEMLGSVPVKQLNFRKPSPQTPGVRDVAWA